MSESKLPLITFWSLVLVVCFDSTYAQSGRRLTKPIQSPTTAASQIPTGADSPGSETPSTQKTKLLVGRQPTSRHLLSEDTIYSAFIARLNASKNVEATPIGDLKREQAVKRALTESSSFVVLLQLEIDNYQEGTIVLNSPDLEIKYFVFAPITGKEKHKGKVYYQAIGGARARKDAWPNGPPIKITPEAAAFAAADRLYDWLLLIVGIRER